MSDDHEALLSSLCQSWHWDSDGEHTITFNSGGTGQLVSRAEMSVWIASQFTWKAIDSPATTADNQLAIQIQLTQTRIPPWDSPTFTGRINEQVLIGEAFVPKSYLVTIERGSFIAPWDAQHMRRGAAPKYAFQLTFDQSPYPPRKEWREPEGGPDTLKIWDKKTFCAGKVESEEKGWFKSLFQ
ncbi:hypothetical protein VNI00_006975 [Paramarasmius palmivorus]|uniref:Uncharacterized protein n=1 Tax=Paramarasmius palmivorus TaxID=297713 RepID=A0AAW0D0W7_9AGAR